MSIFKSLKKEVECNPFNKRIIDGAMYQIMVRYLDIEYGFGGNIDWKENKNKSCEYFKVATCDDKVAIKLIYTSFPKENLCLAEFCKIMTDITDYIFKCVINEYSDDPFESIVSDDMRESYVTEKIHGICANIYSLASIYPNIHIVTDLRQNWQVHNILIDGYRSGLDLHSSVIFHEDTNLMKENEYNVRDMSLNTGFSLLDIKTVLMVYSGTVFNPRERTAPLFPMMDYIIARSYYSRYKIGESIGFEGDVKLYIARARHAKQAHEFCIDFLDKYHEDRTSLAEEFLAVQAHDTENQNKLESEEEE